jgi:hypothetical protein
LKSNVVHDTAVDAAVAVTGLHEGFAKVGVAGSGARSLATRETSLGETKRRPSDGLHRPMEDEIQWLMN